MGSPELRHWWWEWRHQEYGGSANPVSTLRREREKGELGLDKEFQTWSRLGRKQMSFVLDH